MLPQNGRTKIASMLQINRIEVRVSPGTQKLMRHIFIDFPDSSAKMQALKYILVSMYVCIYICNPKNAFIQSFIFILFHFFLHLCLLLSLSSSFWYALLESTRNQKETLEKLKNEAANEASQCVCVYVCVRVCLCVWVVAVKSKQKR